MNRVINCLRACTTQKHQFNYLINRIVLQDHQTGRASRLPNGIPFKFNNYIPSKRPSGLPTEDNKLTGLDKNTILMVEMYNFAYY